LRSRHPKLGVVKGEAMRRSRWGDRSNGEEVGMKEGKGKEGKIGMSCGNGDRGETNDYTGLRRRVQQTDKET